MMFDMMPIFRGEMTRKVRQSTGEARQVQPCRHHVPMQRIMGANAGIPQSRTTWPVAASCRMRESLTRRPASDYAPRIAHGGRSMNDDATERVVEFAKHVIGYMQSAFPGWNEVYVRFDAPSDVQYGVRASYATAAGIELISTMQHRGLVDGVMHIGAQLRDALANDGKKFRVALFRADSRFSYRMDYEWNDHARWNITKLGGASGLPDGLEVLEPLD
ncbi:hypothetical protein [Burkholderia pyrrocinia]|uniref:Uncharacterized protein n=1 Tax=Burkholderia pyrrocinia TaxID=60550 RepID=A0ABZ3BX23_BURPY